jgi:hypothetical protein
MRTAVERVNSRIDGAFMFEHHYIRGKDNLSTFPTWIAAPSQAERPPFHAPRRKNREKG